MKKQYGAAILTVIVWSTMAAIVKSMLGELPSLQVLSIGSFFAFLFLLVLNLASGRLGALRACPPRTVGTMAGLGFLGLFLYSSLYYHGLNWLTAQEACILNYLWPIMLVVFSILLLKEKMTAAKAVALVCSFAGIVILSSGGDVSAGGHRMAGILCCVTAAACYGLFCVLNKKADLDQNLTMMVAWLTASVCAGAVGLLTETWVPVRGIHWLGLLWMGVVVDGAGYLLWALALRGSENTASIANLAYLTPFLSVVVCAVFLREPVRPRAILALCFIVGGILLQSIWAARKESPPAPPAPEP